MIEMLFSGLPPAPITGKITKIQSDNNRFFALDVDGDLYARGVDSATTGVLGNNGVSSIGAWVKILTNVRDFWVSPQFTIMNTNDDRWFWNGRFLDATSNGVLVPTEITSKFSAVTSPVKKLVVGSYGAAILDTAGKLYTMGYNQNGWLYNGGTSVHHAVMTLRSETNILDIAMGKIQPTFYIHYNDNSVVGAGNSQSGNLGIVQTAVTALRTVADASQGTTKISAGASVIFLYQNLWYFIGANTNGQAGAGTTTQVTTKTLIAGAGVMQAGQTLISDGYKTWIKGSDNLWYYSGNSPQGSGTVTRATVPWNGTGVTAFTQIPVTGYPILGDPISWGSGGANMSYLLYQGNMYGCGDATTNKLLPGLGTTANNLGFRKLNNDFTYVE